MNITTNDIVFALTVLGVILALVALVFTPLFYVLAKRQADRQAEKLDKTTQEIQLVVARTELRISEFLDRLWEQHAMVVSNLMARRSVSTPREDQQSSDPDNHQRG